MKIFNIMISKLFQVFLLFVLFFIWIRFYESNLLITVVLGGVLTFIADMLISFVLSKKNYKRNLKSGETKLAENYANMFALSEQKIAVDFFFELLSKKFNATKKTDCILFENNDLKTTLFPVFCFENLNLNLAMEIYKKSQKFSSNKIIICTSSYDKSLLNFLKLLPIKTIVLDKFEVYEKLMKPFNHFPQNSVELKKPQNSVSSLVAFALNKKRCKGYVVSSLILFVSSMFVKVSAYYLVISTILLLLAIFSFINSTYNPTINQDIL